MPSSKILNIFCHSKKTSAFLAARKDALCLRAVCHITVAVPEPDGETTEGLGGMGKVWRGNRRVGRCFSGWSPPSDYIRGGHKAHSIAYCFPIFCSKMSLFQSKDASEEIVGESLHL